MKSCRLSPLSSRHRRRVAMWRRRSSRMPEGGGRPYLSNGWSKRPADSGHCIQRHQLRRCSPEAPTMPMPTGWSSLPIMNRLWKKMGRITFRTWWVSWHFSVEKMCCLRDWVMHKIWLRPSLCARGWRMHTMNSNLVRLIPREDPLRIHRIGDKLVIKEVRGCNLVRGADGRDGSVGLTFPEAMQTHIQRQEWL